MKRVFFALALSAALASPALAASNDKLDAPPPGITPTTATLAQVLKAYDAAKGHLAPGAADTRQEAWTFTKAGMAGTETLVRSGLDYYSRIVRGPFVDEYGQFFGHGWHRGPNGVVSPVSSPQYTSFEMLLFMRNLDDAADPKNDVTVLGEVQTPKPAYVLQIKPSGGKHPEFAFYDKQTGLIDRFDFVVDDTRTTTMYDDYRTTDGLTAPWHVHFTDGTAPLDYDFVRTSLTIGKSIDAKQFAIPSSTFGFVYYNGEQSLPVNIYTDSWMLNIGSNRYHMVHSPTVIVRLNVGGRGLDFALSAAQPRSLIDFEVAQELHLSSYGQVIHANGSDVSYDTVIPQADWGSQLLLRNWAVRATPFHYHLKEGTKIVGVIGYDVLSSGVFKTDYDNARMSVFPPSAFDTPAPEVKNAATIPISIDSGLPFFTGFVANHETPNILFDNAFELSLIFGDFTSEYPDAVKDAVTGQTHAVTMIPFADSTGYGKDVHVWLGQVPDLNFGPAHFMNFPILASNATIDFGPHDVDAVMGGDLLKYYDVYLDYPHNRIFLRPNNTFFRVFQFEPQK